MKKNILMLLCSIISIVFIGCNGRYSKNAVNDGFLLDSMVSNEYKCIYTYDTIGHMLDMTLYRIEKDEYSDLDLEDDMVDLFLFVDDILNPKGMIRKEEYVYGNAHDYPITTIIHTWDYKGNESVESYQSEYDANGNEVKRTYADGKRIITTYDAQGCPIDITYVMNGEKKRTSLTRDNNGKMIQMVDYNYDMNTWLMEDSFVVTPNRKMIIYDANGNCVDSCTMNEIYDKDGHLIDEYTDESHIHYEYDERGNISKRMVDTLTTTCYYSFHEGITVNQDKNQETIKNHLMITE